MSRVIKKIGISTCGGDCPGLNPVIRAITLSGIRKYGWEVIGIEGSTCGLLDLNYKGPHGNMNLTFDSVDQIITKGGTILGSSNKSHPFRYAQKKQDGTYEEVDVSDRVVENFKKLQLDALVMIGGDGSMEVAYKLLQKGIPIVGVPKTIDNDLLATDVTFGFDTAVQTITESIDKIRDTATSHARVIIVEVMGRNAGWLALHSGIASAADVVLIPEIPYTLSSVLKKIKERRDQNQYSSIIVISEGAKPLGGEESTLGPRKPGEMVRLKGAAERLEKELEYANKEGTPYFIQGLEVRTSVLGYIQRGGSPSNFDRVLGTRLGAKAAELIHQGQFGQLVSLSGQNIISVDLRECSKGQRLVDPKCELVQTAKDVGISFGDQ